MAKPQSENEVTVRRLSDVIVGVWDKVKANTVSDVAWDSTNSKLTKTKNGTASDVVTKDTLLSALKGSIADGNTGFVNGDAAYDALALKANLASPTFTGTPKAPTAATGTNTTQIATTAFVKTAVDTAIAGVADALIYKGTVAGGSTGSYGALTPAANKGDTYKVSTAGKIDGKVVEIGDMLICNTDNTAQATDSNYATIAANWDVIQANIDGAVTGPASSTAGHIATFNGATGKVIKDSGYTIATSVPANAVFTDTKVTSVGNHYTPATDSSAEKDASGGTATQLPTSSGSSNVQVVTGITMDAKGHVTGVVSKGLYSHDTTYESKSAVSGGSTVSLCTTGEKYTWNNKQDALQTQTAYSAKGSATKVPQITTNTLGQVTGITEVTIAGVTPASHTHGNITNNGGITATAVTVANGDSLVIVDSSDADKKVAKSSISFDGTTTTTALTPKGTFEAFAKSSDITTAINALDATKTSTDGTNVQVKITETDGKITAVNVTTDNTENKNNKVTTWSATTTDAHYPSEKLVKDTIDEQGQVVAAALNDLDDRVTECEAITTSGAVLYNTAQSLTSDQKTQARSNIGAGTSNLAIGTTSSTAAAGNHGHGNIANGGTLTDTAAAAAGNDYVVIRDADNSKIQTSTIKGTDVADAVSKKHSHSSLTLSTTAQAYDGSHTLALPSTDPYTSARKPASHTHGNITNDGKIGSTADRAVVTTTGGAVTTANLTTSSPSPGDSPTVSFIATVSQDSRGQISATKQTIRTATNNRTGIVQLATSIGATVSTENGNAATEKAVRDALDANGKGVEFIDFVTGTFDQITAIITAGKLPVVRFAVQNQSTTVQYLYAPLATSIEASPQAYIFALTNGSQVLTFTCPKTGNWDMGTYGPFALLNQVVRYDQTQSLTDTQKAKARDNIGAGTSSLVIGTTAATAAAGNHTHGNISNAGAITTSADLGTGDALVFTDSSDSNKLKKTSITFDGSTATKALTQKGTWETFNNYTHPTTSGNKHIPSGGSSGQFLGWDSDGTAKWVSNPNSDTKVTQTLVASDNTSEYPILLAPTGQTATATTTSNFVTGAKYKPSTNTLTVNVSGNAATASAAKSGSSLETAINGKAASNHTHTASIAADSSSGTVVSLSANTQYKLTAGGSSVLFKTPDNPTVNNGALKIGLNGATATSKFTANQSTDSTLTFATGSANGTISVDGTDVAVKGLGSAAYTASTAYAASGHTHTTSIASSSATSSITLEVGKKYSISAGGTSYVFTNGTEMTTTEVDDLLAELT